MLATFVRWRWGAAGRKKRFNVMGDDMPGLRRRFAADHEETWLHLLAFAADQLAWAAPLKRPFGFSECLREIASHKHMELRCRGVFDRLDYLERIASGWRSLNKEGRLPAPFLELLSQFWTRPFPEIRRDVTALLAAIDAKKETWLTHLDRVKEASPPVLSLFGQMLDAYSGTLDLEADGRDPAELTVLAHYFLEENAGRVYSVLRPRLLAFCLREVIDPDVIVQLRTAGR